MIANCNLTKYTQIANDIKLLARELGLSKVGITTPTLTAESEHLSYFLQQNYCGGMHYLKRNLEQRLHPEFLVPGTKSIICVSASYPVASLTDKSLATFTEFVDYHLKIKNVLEVLIEKLKQKHQLNSYQFQAFCGNAPIMEKPLAAKAGLGWIGKNTLLVDKDIGSFQFLGEIFTDLPLPQDNPIPNLCGNCQKCLESCPTKALIGPQQLDARKCIAYLTIENRGSIPEELRSALGQRIYGCDTCQKICPWNRKRIEAKLNPYPSLFSTNSLFSNLKLHELFSLSVDKFQEMVTHSPINRITFECFLRNIAVALGNAEPTAENIAALASRINHPSPLVREHCQWAWERLKTTKKRKTI